MALLLTKLPTSPSQPRTQPHRWAVPCCTAGLVVANVLALLSQGRGAGAPGGSPMLFSKLSSIPHNVPSAPCGAACALRGLEWCWVGIRGLGAPTSGSRVQIVETGGIVGEMGNKKRNDVSRPDEMAKQTAFLFCRRFVLPCLGLVLRRENGKMAKQKFSERLY